MGVKKVLITVFIFAVLGWGIFWSVSKFRESKKNMSVSVAELVISNQQLITNNETGAIDSVQDPVAGKQENSVATDNMPPLIPGEPKNEVSKNPPAPVKESVKVSSGKIISRLVTFGFQKSSARNIRAIIIHTSYNNIGGNIFDFDKVVQEWKDAGVAPHYAIDRDGTSYQLVADQNIAWHAGSSKLPDGTTDVNGVSIGIEVINSKDSKFTEAQYSTLNSLIATLKEKYSIKYVLGHDDIAPGRKTDPWGIEWGKVQK